MMQKKKKRKIDDNSGNLISTQQRSVVIEWVEIVDNNMEIIAGNDN